MGSFWLLEIERTRVRQVDKVRTEIRGLKKTYVSNNLTNFISSFKFKIILILQKVKNINTDKKGLIFLCFFLLEFQ